MGGFGIASGWVGRGEAGEEFEEMEAGLGNGLGMWFRVWNRGRRCQAQSRSKAGIRNENGMGGRIGSGLWH